MRTALRTLALAAAIAAIPSTGARAVTNSYSINAPGSLTMALGATQQVAVTVSSTSSIEQTFSLLVNVFEPSPSTAFCSGQLSPLSTSAQVTIGGRAGSASLSFTFSTAAGADPGHQCRIIFSLNSGTSGEVASRQVPVTIVSVPVNQAGGARLPGIDVTGGLDTPGTPVSVIEPSPNGMQPSGQSQLLVEIHNRGIDPGTKIQFTFAAASSLPVTVSGGSETALIVDGAALSQGVTVQLLSLGATETTPVIFRVTASR